MKKNIGIIKEISGSVVEITFDKKLPALYN